MFNGVFECLDSLLSMASFKEIFLRPLEFHQLVLDSTERATCGEFWPTKGSNWPKAKWCVIE